VAFREGNDVESVEEVKRHTPAPRLLRRHVQCRKRRVGEISRTDDPTSRRASHDQNRRHCMPRDVGSR
jgi:hypothetical protein